VFIGLKIRSNGGNETSGIFLQDSQLSASLGVYFYVELVVNYSVTRACLATITQTHFKIFRTKGVSHSLATTAPVAAAFFRQYSV
jgi:hypothetical protein